MKNLEEDTLKRFLQDTFSDYESEPSDLTWEHIRKEIQPQQPSVGAGLRQWIVPVVALLLLIVAITWNKNNSGNKTELAIISTEESLDIEPQVIDYQNIKINKLIKIRRNNTEEKSEKTFVNKATSKVESKVIAKIEKSFELPTFSTIKIVSMVKQDVQEYAVSTKEFVGIEEKPVAVNVQAFNQNEGNQVGFSDNNKPGNAGGVQNLVSIRNSPFVVSILNNDPFEVNKPFNPNSNEITLINEVIIQEIRHIKPLEMLKNKDFVLVKNELMFPQISKININREAKPIRRHLFVSMNITPFQTYRILTVNSQNVQNLQTNNLFDAERNGWAFDLGITKQIGNKWNLRSGISYLKMRQWAEYQINTDVISVKNSNNYSNAVSVGNNDNEFIGQTRIEAKTL